MPWAPAAGDNERVSPRRRHPALVSIVAALATPLAAASAAGAPGPGWTSELVASAGLRIAIPPGWAPLAIGGPASAPSARFAGIAAIARSNDLLKFAAVGSAGGDLLEMSVVALSSRQRQEIGLRAELSSAFLGSGLSPSAIHEHPLALPAGPAEQLTLSIVVAGTRMQITDFVLRHDGAEIEVGYAAALAASKALAATVLRSIRSLRYVR